MSLRLRLLFMLSTFLVLIGVFAAGTLLIFEKMSANLSTLHAASDAHRLIGELENSMTNFINVTKYWGYTGNRRFKEQYHNRLAAVYESFGNISEIIKKDKNLEKTGDEFKKLLIYSKVVIDHRYPVGNKKVLNNLQLVESKGKEILELIGKLHSHSIVTVMNVAKSGEEIKRNMIYYLLLLIVFSSIMSVFLIITIRKTIAKPLL